MLFQSTQNILCRGCNNWLVSNPGRVITQWQMAELFGTAYCRSASVDKAVSAFRTCGIWPVDPGVFTDEDFAPSVVTDTPINEETSTSTILNDSQTNEEASSSRVTDTQITEESSTSGGTYAQINEDVSASRVTEMEMNEESLFSGVPSTSGTQSVTIILREKPEVFPELATTSVSPKHIRPFPKRKDPQQRRKKGQKSEIITSSPFKDQLQAKADEKLRSLSKTTNSEKQNTKCAKRKQCFADDNSKINQIKMKKKNGDESTTQCPACGEAYTDPPFEDWIMCKMCSEWWHENCSSYEGSGEFICDQC